MDEDAVGVVGGVGMVGGLLVRNAPSPGWVMFRETELFAGWIAVLVGLVDGAPRLIGLQLKPTSVTADQVALDASTIARLPLRTLTVVAARVLDLMPDGRTRAPEGEEAFTDGSCRPSGRPRSRPSDHGAVPTSSATGSRIPTTVP